MSDSYKTIASSSDAQYIEKRSRFLAFAHPILSEDEAKEIITNLRKKYYDARHVCYAYVLGHDAWTTDYDPVARGTAIMRSCDDGEPGGSAGKPILGQLRARELTNTFVAVVRYFGGVKLGTGGLAVAYKTAASDALDATTVEEKFIMAYITIDVPYTEVDCAMRFIKDSGGQIVNREYTPTSTILKVATRMANEDAVKSQLSKIHTIKFLSSNQS